MKRALVTGGSGAIGSAIAKELARAGVHVIVHANANLEAARNTVDLILTAGGSAEPLALDLRDAANAREALGTMAMEKPIQIFVHSAGLQRDVPFAGMEDTDWHDVIDVNLNSFYSALRPLIMPMIRTRWGRIVAISSITAITGNRGQTNYAAAKGGLHALTKSLTREYAERGVTANVVAPGLIETPETEGLSNYEQLLALCPAGRAGTPEDVAAIVGFLVSDRASYLSGQMIAVDGGTS